jgi:hypothetical protein
MKLIYLEWEDAASSSSWKFKSDIDKWANSPSNSIHQVGFVLKETKKYLVLCGRWSPAGEDIGDEEAYGLLQKIPKTWVRKRINLTKYIR